MQGKFPIALSGIKSVVKRKISRIVDIVTSAFDRSITAELLHKIRKAAPAVKASSVGLTILFFGLYSLIIAAFKMLFNYGGELEDIFVSVSCIVVSIPWFIKKDNIGRALAGSSVGRAICSSVGIRVETLETNKKIGRANIAFLLGTLFGALTFFVSPLSVVSVCVLVFAVALILIYPEASVIMAMLLLPIGFPEIVCKIAAFGAVSYTIKLFRRKRTLVISTGDKFALVFFVIVIFASFVYYGEGFSRDLRYFLLMLFYFLVSFSANGEAFSKKAMATLVLSSSVCASFAVALSVLGRLLSNSQIEIGYSFVLENVFDVPPLLVMSMALVPVAVSYFFQPKMLPYRTAFLCLISLVSFLLLAGNYYMLLSASIGVMLVLFFRNKRAAYTVFALSCVLFISWLYVKSRDKSALSLIFDMISGLFSEGEAADYVPMYYYLIGEGLGDGFAFSGDLYRAISSRLGIVSTVSLLLTVVFFGADVARASSRYHKIEAEKTHRMLSSAVPLFSVVTLLVCGLLINVWKYESIFAIFWIMLGISSARLKGAKQDIARAVEKAEYDEDICSASFVIGKKI